jgi:hypothetical protein
MPHVRHPRIVIALLLALFWGGGYLVGSSAQKLQEPEGAGLVNGAFVKTVPLDPKGVVPWASDYYVRVHPSCVLVQGGSDYIVDRGGVLILPLHSTVGVCTSTSVNLALVTAVVAGPSTTELPVPSKNGFY